MARVTVEDCIDRVENRFELVIATSQRSREISAGSEPLVDRDKDKNPVIALREVAEDKVDTSELIESVTKSMQHQIEVDEPEEDDFGSITSDEQSNYTAHQEYTEEVAAASGMTIDETSDDSQNPAGYEDVTVEEASLVKKD